MTDPAPGSVPEPAPAVAATGPRLQRMRSRVGVGVASQAVSSAGNFIVPLIGARYLSSADFGAFAIGTILTFVVGGLLRAVVTEPALIVATPDREMRRRIVASAFAFGLAASAVLLLAAPLTDSRVRSVVIALALCLPTLLVHDAGRYVAFTMQRPEVALLLDVVWGVTQLVTTVALLATSNLTPWSLTVAWNGTAALGALAVLYRLRVVRPSFRWVSESRAMSWRFAVEWSAWAGASQVAMLGLGSVVGLAAVGGMRATQVLLGPVNILYSGAVAVLMPERGNLGLERFRRRTAQMAGGLALVALAITGIGLAVPTKLGVELFGDTWPLMHDLLLPAGAVQACSAINSGAILGLRGLGAIQESLSVRLRAAPGIVIVPLISGALWGVHGFAWALAVWCGLAAIAWWRTFLKVYAIAAASPDPDSHLRTVGNVLRPPVPG